MRFKFKAAGTAILALVAGVWVSTAISQDLQPGRPTGGASNASAVTYTPAESGDWEPDPANVAAGLDEMASRVSSLEASGFDATTITYTPSDLGSWVDPDPTNVSVALDDVAARTSALETFDGTLGALATADDSTEVPYTPTTGTDWTDPDPTDVAIGLDALASRVTSLEGVTVDAAAVTYTPTTATDWTDPDPTDTEGAIDTLASRMVAVESASYQPLDDMLTSIVALDGTGGDKGVYLTAADTAATFTLTEGGRAIGGAIWTAGTQVPALTAAGTLTMVTVGSGASNVLTLDGSGDIPAGVGPSATATWSLLDYDADRDSATGDASDNGWTETGSTHGIGSDGGIEHHGVTATSAAVGHISKTVSITSADAWEVSVEFFPNVAGSLQANVAIFDGTRVVDVRFATTGITEGTAGAVGDFGTVISKWITVTVRKVGDADGVVEFWIGPYLVGEVNYTDCTTSATAANVRIGKATTTGSNVIQIRSAKMNAGLANPLPSVRFANTARGR